MWVSGALGWYVRTFGVCFLLLLSAQRFVEYGSYFFKTGLNAFLSANTRVKFIANVSLTVGFPGLTLLVSCSSCTYEAPC